MGPLQAVDEVGRDFGPLPPHLRGRIEQAKDRGFPDGYESILESYYRRLAKSRADGLPTVESPPQDKK